jgi:leucyl aminopeptidase
MVDHLTARRGKDATAITVVAKKNYKKWVDGQPQIVKNWLAATDFDGDPGRVALLPSRTGTIARVLLVVGDTASPWSYAAAASHLPQGKYAFDKSLATEHSDAAALGWALATYHFGRYRPAKKKRPTLVWPTGADRADVTRIAEGITLGRDLINTPAEDMGPGELVQAGIDLAGRHGAKTKVIEGEALLKKGFPAIHTVGRASARAPRLFDLTWGNPSAPKLTLVGKGVCFDTGGLDLKTSAGMKLMKKDMGGAAMALGLAHMVMSAELPVRLRVLVPAVENSVSGVAYRPGDVMNTRKGITVEVGNTDAEGRLVLCDALAEADGEKPDLLLDFATLTGAARVALGTELPGLWSTDDAFAGAVIEQGRRVFDPLWRMPLHRGYRRQLDSPIAHLNNISTSPYGGAITAALFLDEFIDRRTRWCHVDTMAWNLSSRPGRPAGGEVFGARAFYAAIADRYRSAE